MPVTTPMAKLMRKSLPKNLVSWRYFTLPVRKYAVWKPATSHTVPRVSGTNRKW